MGNCSPKGVTTVEESSNPIRVRTNSGEIMEFKAPKLAKDVVSEFPGFSIYRDTHPVPHCEYLLGGQFYCLVPVKIAALPEPGAVPSGDDGPVKPKESSDSKEGLEVKEVVEPQGKGSAALHVLPSHRDGVWKVKLVIDPKRLEEIWSEQENVEALIENMRMVAAAAASTESFTPRRSRSSWGVYRKAASLSHMLKLPN